MADSDQPSNLVHASTMDRDVLIEILKRLPSKTLGRFLCVSKHWKTLISSNLFIFLHKSFTRFPTPPKLKPYIQVRHNSTSYRIIHSHQQLKPTKLHFPFRPSTHTSHTKRSPSEAQTVSRLYFVDVIHGVVCVSYSSESGFDSTILWNPSIRKFVSLPRLPLPVDIKAVRVHHEQPSNRPDVVYWTYMPLPELLQAKYLAMAKLEFSVIGFGYDTRSHVFKVVRVWIPRPDDGSPCGSSPVLPVYEVVACSSLEEGGFRRRVAKAPRSLGSCKAYEGSRTSCFVNGNVHWIIGTPRRGNGRRRSVLMFDCESESFRIVDLPHGILAYSHKTWHSEARQTTKLMEYAGMLSVVANYCLDHEYTTNTDFTRPIVIDGTDIRCFATELWAMEEHGVATTWTKLYRFKNTVVDGLPERKSLWLELDICRDSFVNMAPYDVEKWNNSARVQKKYWSHGVIERQVYQRRFDTILSGRVYEESMFLMDHPEAQSYADKDEEEIVADAEFRRNHRWDVMVNHGRSSVLGGTGDARPSYGYYLYISYGNIPSH